MTRACGTSSFFSQYTTLIHPIDCLLSPKGDKRLAKLRSWIPWGDGPLSWMGGLAKPGVIAAHLILSGQGIPPGIFVAMADRRVSNE